MGGESAVPVCVAYVCIVLGAVLDASYTLAALTYDLQQRLATWQADATRACEHATHNLDLGPRLLVQSVVDATASAAETGVRAIGQLVLGLLLITRTLLHMLCASYKSLLLCTVQLVVQSVLSVMDAAAQAIATAIHDAAQALHDLLNTAAEAGVGLADIAVDGLDAMLGLSLKPPTWHEPMALQALRNVSIPLSLIDPFREIRDKLPTVSALRLDAEDVLDAALDAAQQHVKQTLAQFALPRPPWRPPPASAFSCATLAAQSLGTARTDIQHGQLYTWLSILALGAAALVLGLVVLGANTGAMHWMVDAELVAGGLRAERAALQRIWTTAPPWPTLDGAIAAMQRSYDDTNAAWAQAEQSLTHALFGWVNSTALAAHDVLHGALDLATGTVDDMLGHTPLHNPVAQFVQCVLGSKVQSADAALHFPALRRRPRSLVLCPAPTLSWPT
ncbi:plasma membrane fusion protein prm1 [Malassezia nana]|uniref:Plasma membrane fusion protein PRM1 n=1 Tax=Malassezia nana TaxID=180528 RepID=A0AAF0EQY9_9BASI|nr:plasma membrane fusion protein prm1 [Malassezia nana]